MNPETKRTPELEELLIDAEADDDVVQHTPPLVTRPWLLLLGLILVALNLRPALSSMAPLLSEVSASLGLPSILIGRGLSATEAGLALSGSIIVQLVSSLAAPWLATRGKDQRLAIVVVMLLTLGGLFGCLYAPLDGLWGWAILLGLGQGGTFSLALTLIVLRSRDSHVAANLSSMAQGIGYTLASMGPFAVGLVHDWTGGWSAVGWIFAVIGIGAIIAGLGAGRAQYVQVNSEKL